MAYETSYDVGSKPFNHDKHRGKWLSSMDFFFACVGHAFKIEAVYIIPSALFQDTGYFALIPYSISMIVCAVPIIFIQSFLGQFSGTGFISVFRIAPLFKGIGYLSLAINITTLTYQSIFAALPFFYFFQSMKPTLPWSCEGQAYWRQNLAKDVRPCNITMDEVDPEERLVIDTPSLDFFLRHIDMSSFHRSESYATFSFPLIACSFIIWAAVWYVVRKPTEKIGKIIRYSTLTMLATLTICVLRFACLPGALSGLHRFYQADWRQIHSAIPFMTLVAMASLGPGWGSILTMASYNKFKTDIKKNTWILALGQFGLMMLGSLSWMFIENFLRASNPKNYIMYGETRQWMQFMTVASALPYLEAPHFWSLLYFGMLTVGATTLLVVQLFSVLTSLFDEYEVLREKRDDVIRIAAVILALGSTIYCSNYGFATLVIISRCTIITQILLNLMLLLVVLWIYGRVRLQRDLKFMINRTYPTWMVYIVRFGAPLFLLYSFLVGLFIARFDSRFAHAISLYVIALIVLPWLLIPGYCIFKIRQTTGLVGRRFRKSVQPIDWYPVDPVDRQRYEEALGNSEISHQLTTTIEDDV